MQCYIDARCNATLLYKHSAMLPHNIAMTHYNALQTSLRHHTIYIPQYIAMTHCSKSMCHRSLQEHSRHAPAIVSLCNTHTHTLHFLWRRFHDKAHTRSPCVLASAPVTRPAIQRPCHNRLDSTSAGNAVTPWLFARFYTYLAPSIYTYLYLYIMYIYCVRVCECYIYILQIVR